MYDHKQPVIFKFISNGLYFSDFLFIATFNNGFPKDEIMKSKNRKLIHIGSKVPGWVTPKEKVWP
jgi:hypothetical protein